MKKHIPNILTLANLFTGCVGIVYAFQGNLMYAGFAIWIAAIFDFLDGFSARILKVSSAIGKELDSLADMVTFGLLPSVILSQMMEQPPIELLAYLPFILALFSALRLAKFNVDVRQSEVFIGMPTPAAAFFISGLPFWLEVFPEIASWWIILLIAVSISLLLVSEIKMLALKFKNYHLSDNWLKYLLIILSLILLIIFGPKSLTIIVVLYTLLSLLAQRQKLQ